MADPNDDVHGPVDYLLLQFPVEGLDPVGVDELLALVDAGTIRLFDIVVVTKSADGVVSGMEVADLGDRGAGLAVLAGARSGLLGDDDLEEAGSVLAPGTQAVLLVYENAWAVPFVRAASAAGGQVVASARIPALELMAALDELDRRSA